MKKLKLCCKVCYHRGFRQVPSEFKPTFKCDQCGNHWAYGRTGGEYMEYIQNPGEITLQADGFTWTQQEKAA